MTTQWDDQDEDFGSDVDLELEDDDLDDDELNLDEIEDPALDDELDNEFGDEDLED